MDLRPPKKSDVYGHLRFCDALACLRFCGVQYLCVYVRSGWIWMDVYRCGVGSSKMGFYDEGQHLNYLMGLHQNIVKGGRKKYGIRPTRTVKEGQESEPTFVKPATRASDIHETAYDLSILPSNTPDRRKTLDHDTSHRTSSTAPQTHT